MTAPSKGLLIAVCIALLLAVLGGVLWIQDRRAKERIEASLRIAERMREEELAREGNRLTLGEAADGGDARTTYDEVMPLLGALSEDERSLLFLIEWSDATSPWRQDEEDSEAVDAVMARTRPLLDRLRPVLTAPTLTRRIDTDTWSPPGDADWEAFSWIVSEHVQRLVVNGDVEEALDLCVLRWFAALDHARHSGLLAFLRGLSIADTSATDIRRILANCDVPPARLDQLARELETLRASTPGLLDAWRIEEIYLRCMFADHALTSTAFGAVDSHLLSGASDRLTPTRESLAAAVENRPGGQAVAAAEALVDELTDGPNPILAMVFVPFPMAVRREAEVRTLVDMLRVTVALARYRTRHGHPPDDLAALVPDFLTAIPTCSNSGEALRYADGRLWSVGGDGVDGGGTDPLGYDAGVREDGDVVFLLWTDRLQHFPWSDDLDDSTRERVEEAIPRLYAGGTAAEHARDTLVGFGREIGGRLIGEFETLSRDPGLDTPEGRAKAGAIDEVLRRIDGLMESRWREPARIGVDSDPVFVRTIAERWTNWWYRAGWRTDPQEPWDMEDPEDE